MKKLLIAIFAILIVSFALNASPMHGTYTIGGTSPDFSTINDAVTALISNGVDGYTDFNIRTGIYNEQFTIPGITGSNSTNWIVFRAESGNADDVIISHTATSSSDNYIVKLDGVDYIDFHQLTLKAEGTTNLGTVFELLDGSTNIQIRHNKIYGIARTAPYSYLIKAYLNSTQHISDIEVQSNYFYNANTGAYFYTYGSTNISNVTIKYNYFHNIMTAVNLRSVPNVPIENNLIDEVNSGINIEYCSSANIAKNQVFAKKTAINVRYSDYSNVVNNEVMVFGQPFSGSYGLGEGIVLYNSNNADIYYNSVNLDEKTSNGNSFAFAQYGSSESKVINNIFANFGKGYSVLLSNVTSSNIDLNHNDIFSGKSFIAKVGNTVYYTLSEFKTEFGENDYSASIYPAFGNNDAHTSTPWLDGKGVPITAITEDLNGNPRDGTNPDIGCDEFTANPAYATPMSGTYDVGTGYDYDNLSDAINELLLRGTNGSVAFYLHNGNYSGNYKLYEIPSSTGSNQVTIALGTGDPDLIYSATSEDDNYVINLMGGNTFYDFSYLTIEATGTTYSRVFDVSGYNHFRILGGSISAPFTTSDDRNKDLIYIKNSVLNDVSINTTFNNGSTAICLYGDYDYNSSEVEIWNCDFNNNYMGIYLSYIDSPTVRSNTFNENYKAINIIQCINNFKITQNQIFKTDKSGEVINISTCTGGDIQAERGLIANNTVKMINCGSSSALYTSYSKKFDLVYNSIFLEGNGKALYNYYEYGTNLYENNIFAVKGTGLAVDLGTASFGSVMDYNALYSEGASLIRMGGTTYSNIDELQTATSTNLHSFSAYPYFTEDMHTTSSILDSKGISINSIVDTDMDGQYRTNPSDVGADSFAPLPGTEPMSGIYTIGTSKSDFSSFNDAAYALSYRGISDSTIFLVETGTYTEQVEFKEIYGTSSTKKVIFRSNTGIDSDVILQYGPTTSDSNYVVFLNGPDYIAIRDLTIKSTMANNYYNTLIRINGNVEGLQIVSNTLHNDSGTNYGDGNSIIYAQHNSFSSRIIYGNTFDNGYCGYTHYNYDNGENSGLHIYYNHFNGTKYPVSCSSDAIQIHDNTMDDFIMAVDVNYCDGATKIYNNKMSTHGFSDYYHSYNLFSISSCNADSTNPILIYNNTLYAYDNHITGLTGYNIYNCEYLDFYYNNAVIENDYDIYVNATRGTALSLQSSNHVNVKNNILAYKGNGLAFDLQTGGYTDYDIDYNNLYSEGLFLSKIVSNKYKTIQEIRDDSDFSDHSVKAPPLLDGNLFTTSKFLNGKGTPVSSVTHDIQGTLRDATTPDIGCYEFSPSSPWEAITGTKTIGTSKSDYSTIPDAINDLLSRGVTGGVVTFEIQSGTYDQQMNFLYIPRDNFTGYVIFKPQSGNAGDVNIRYDATDNDDNYILRIIGSNYLTFSKLKFTPLDTSYNRVALIKAYNENLSFGECIFDGVSGASYNNGAILKFDLASFKTIWLSNNEFNNGGYAIYYTNYNYPEYANTFLIANNNFTNNYDAMYIKSVSNLFIENNTMTSIGNYGMDIENISDNLSIYKNSYTNSGSRILELSGYDGTGADTHRLANNFFYLGNQTSSRNAVVLAGIDNFDIYLNTFKSEDNTLYGKTFYLENGSGNSNLNIQDNIFANMSGGYAISVQNDSGITTMDHNLFYSTGTNFTYWENVDYSDLATLQTASGMNSNSILSDPVFLFSDKPDLQSSSPAINTGITISSITDDIYGTSRDANYDIGAYEYVGGITPAIPQNVTIQIINANTARISWDAASQATQYKVEFSDTPNGTFMQAALTTNTTVDIPISSTKKFYRVRALH